MAGLELMACYYWYCCGNGWLVVGRGRVRSKVMGNLATGSLGMGYSYGHGLMGLAMLGKVGSRWLVGRYTNR